MIKNFFLFLNLLLLVFFACRLLALNAEIKSGDADKKDGADYRCIALKKPVSELSHEYRNIFGLVPKKNPPHGTRKSFTPQADNLVLNELVSGNEVVRVMGIFISKDIKYAVISIFDKKKKRLQIKSQKIGVGDKIKDFSVVSILPGSVALADNASNKTELRIFKSF